MGRALTFSEAIATLERASVFGVNPSLEGVTELTAELGRPQDTFASVQITGTNGKTSTARITAALLLAEGCRVGLYTSPHLERYPERIEVAGAAVSDDEFALAVAATVEATERLKGSGGVGTASGFTEFELLTAAALWLFREHDVEIAVLEVGLGGRWDATSVVSPSVAVITGIGLDHTAILGETLEQIAADKAAIIKHASAPVLGPGTAGLEAVFLARTREVGTHARAVRENGALSPVAEELTVRYRTVALPESPGAATVLDVAGVHGAYAGLCMRAPGYQAANVATAVAAAEASLGRALDVERARAALARVTIPGRFELVRKRPPVIVDGSHNPQAAAALACAIREAFPMSHTARPTVLLGVLADKDAHGIVAELVAVASAFAVTQPRSVRALDAEALGRIVVEVTGKQPAVFGTIPEALAQLTAGRGRPLVVSGSLTTAGQARIWLRDAWATSG